MNALNIAEIAPAAPAAAELLAPLGMLCVLVVCYGMVLGIDAIARGFFGTVSGVVGWIPYLGHLIESPIHKIEQKIVSFLGGLEQHIDSAIGHSWHTLASVATHLWHTLERDSQILWQALKFLSGVPTLHELLHAERWLRHSIRAAAQIAAHALRHAILHEERALRSVAHGVYPRLRSLEHEVTRTLPREIRHARDLAREAEDGVARLWKEVKALPGARYIDAAVAAAIAALGLVGLDLLRCKEAGDIYNKRGCALWSDLDALLGLVAIPLEIASLYELIGVAQTVTEDVTKGVESLLNV